MKHVQRWLLGALVCCGVMAVCLVKAEASPFAVGKMGRGMSVGGHSLVEGVTPKAMSLRLRLFARQTGAKVPSSFAPVSRQTLALNGDLLTASLVVLIPTVAIELTLFIGNLAAFSSKKRLLAWGIQGMGFAVLGGAVTLPWIVLGLDSGIAVSFIALHLVLLGISISNVVLAMMDRVPTKKVAVVPWGNAQGGGVACVGQF